AEPVGKELENKENFISWIRSLTQDQISYAEVKAFIDYAFEVSLVDKDLEFSRFRDRFLFFVRRFLENGGELYDLLDVYKCFIDTFNFPVEFTSFCKSELIPAMIETYSRVQAEESYYQTIKSNKINALKNKLLSIRSLENLGEVLRSELPSLGILQAYLVFSSSIDGVSKLVVGYDRSLSSVKKQDFSSLMLLPEELSKNISRGAYVVLPLTYDSEYLGYLLVDVTEQRDECFLEDLRASISSTLKGISLLDTANKAKDIAEKAERASSDFFDSISDGLKEPLEQMKQILCNTDFEQRKELMNHLLKAEHLLDLCYTEKGQIELFKKLISPTPFFRDIANKLCIEANIPNSLPAIYADSEKIIQVSEILYQLATEDNGQIYLEVSIKPAGLSIFVSSSTWNPMEKKGEASLSLAEKIVVLHNGSFHFKEHGISICLPWPSLSNDVTLSTAIGYTLYIKKDEYSVVPETVRTLPQVLFVTESELADEFEIPDNVTRIAWDYSDKREKESIVLNLLKNHQRSKNMPFLCFNVEPSSLDLWSTLKTGTHDSIDGTILILGSLPNGLSKLSSFGSFLNVKDGDELLNYSSTPAMIILSSASFELVIQIRKEKRFAKVPVLMVKDHFEDGEIDKIAQLPNLIICNSCLCDSDEFISRLIGIFGGNVILPPLTGALVKKAIGFLNKKATCQISRWQLAEYVNISEDYLTRIFKKDMGLSPWDYLNRYRVQLATEMLTQTGATINEVANATGFQDQAYFCRVFKKIKSVSPGQIRNRT
ncbi:MAG: AraC family transcriptional regulator, partial [Spirochaetales bacterium]|nr:AraC family transcriptional regulator [Spirochaetales bacterium]